jgi:hypothetical protein
MWQIREEQVDALRSAACGRFVRTCLHQLRAAHRAETAARSDVELRALIVQGVARANSYGIDRECDIISLVGIMVTDGVDFDTRADGEWARAILWDRTLSGPEKTRRLCAAAPNSAIREPNP